MIKIDEKYLKIALDIRKTYISYMIKISEYEEEIKKLLDKLTEIKNNLSKIDKNDKNIAKIQVDVVLDVQKNIEKINTLLLPYSEKILELEKQSKLLYDNICEIYGNELIKEDIQSQISKYVDSNMN